MNKKLISLSLALSLAVLPALAFAQINTTVPWNQVSDITSLGNKIAQASWVIFGIIAVVCFVIAGILFLTSRGNTEQLTAARSAFIWGVAGVVVGIIAFSIINIVMALIR